MKEIADAKGATPGQLALAWLLHQGGDIAPIPGTKRLEENAGSAEVKLASDDLSRIDEAAPKGVAAGERYDEAGKSTLNV